jgi:hypothetical protein
VRNLSNQKRCEGQNKGMYSQRVELQNELEQEDKEGMNTRAIRHRVENAVFLSFWPLRSIFGFSIDSLSHDSSFAAKINPLLLSTDQSLVFLQTVRAFL